MLSLKTMTESKLKVLKRQVEAALQARVAARRQEIESELSRLSQLDGGGRAKVVRAAATGMAAAKYRKPASASKGAGRTERRKYHVRRSFNLRQNRTYRAAMS